MDRHPGDGPPAAAAVPRRLLETGRGSRPESFGATEWLLLASVAMIWGSSFLFIDIGLEALAPGVIALSRVALGVAALSLVPAARRPIGPEDRVRVAFLGVDVQDFKSDARRFLTRYGTNYVSVRDGDDSTSSAYGVTGIPET